jgi:hypothetical protein
MTILPLIGRELRVRARSPAAYWTRCGAALVGFLICLPSIENVNRSPQAGAAAFNSLVVAAFILCSFSGFLTVDAISRERREGTLGLLFLTPVQALDVLLGKFGAAGLASLCILAALAPVLILPLLAGGVSGGEATRKVLALFDTMILSLAAGLWASARGRSWWSCAWTAAGVLAGVMFGPLFLEFIYPVLRPLRLSWSGPLSALTWAGDTNYSSSPAHYWVSIASVHAISWLLVNAAGIRLGRAWREGDDSEPVRVRHATEHEAFAADETLLNSAPPQGFMLFNVNIINPKHEPLAPGQAPLEWLAGRQIGVRTVVWAGALLGLVFYRGFGLSPQGMPVFVMEGCLFAWAASRFFIEARRNGELELLLTTPEGGKTIVASQWKWLFAVFYWPVVTLMVAPFVELVAALFDRHSNFLIIVNMLLSGVNTVAGIAALLWAGMWFGWSQRSQTGAILRIILAAQGAPYLILMVFSRVIFPLRHSIYSPIPASAGTLLGTTLPRILILLYYLWLIPWASRRLTIELRTPPLEKTGLSAWRRGAFLFSPVADAVEDDQKKSSG